MLKVFPELGTKWKSKMQIWILFANSNSHNHSILMRKWSQFDFILSFQSAIYLWVCLFIFHFGYRPVFGHFTQVITWDAYAIGCSMLTYTNTNAFDPPSLSNQLICNYSIGNLDENPIYNPGPTASDCKTGTNPKYPGLCSENEKYEAWYYV